MSSGKNTSDTDPRTLRAVAHPVRLDLLDLLHREGALTASRCAELLGLTPKVCSYHLSLLGKYGLIEEAGGGRGRTRPWRLAVNDVAYRYRPDEDRTVSSADDQLALTLLARDARIVEEFIARRGGLPERWRNVAAMSSRPLRLTPPRLAAMRAELAAVIDRYADPDPVGDPADSRPVHVAIYAVPVELPGGEP